MSNQDKWDNIIQLDEELLHGGIILSEWTTYLVKDADIAYCSNANLSSILTCQAAIESHLRYDYYNSDEVKKWGFYRLIEESSLPKMLKEDLHGLRNYRNKWVHVNNPQNDEDLLNRPNYHEEELEVISKKSIRLVREVLYRNPWV